MKSFFQILLIPLLLLMIMGVQLDAQPFQKAPALSKKVKKIVEWTRSGLHKKAQKGNTSYFGKDGRILTYYSDEMPMKARRVYEYDPQKRLVKYSGGVEVDREIIRYIYGDNYVTREQHYRMKVYKTVTFLNRKKQPTEEKEYIKGGELGDSYILKNRIIFNYNSRDSLIGEMHYSYRLEGRSKGKKYLRRKTTHHYDVNTRRRLKTVEYDFDKTIRMITKYKYDKKGRHQLITYEFPKSQQKRIVEYKYKNNKIWQKIDEIDNKKTVRVYVDGRLIRLRMYQDGNIFSIVDYQYIYY